MVHTQTSNTENPRKLFLTIIINEGFLHPFEPLEVYLIGRIEKQFFWKFISPRGDYCVVGQYKTQEKNGF